MNQQQQTIGSLMMSLQMKIDSDRADEGKRSTVKMKLVINGADEDAEKSQTN